MLLKEGNVSNISLDLDNYHQLRFSIQCFAVLLLAPIMDAGFSAYGVIAIPVVMVAIWISLSLMVLIQRKSLTRDKKQNINCNKHTKYKGCYELY